MTNSSPGVVGARRSVGFAADQHRDLAGRRGAPCAGCCFRSAPHAEFEDDGADGNLVARLQFRLFHHRVSIDANSPTAAQILDDALLAVPTEFAVPPRHFHIVQDQSAIRRPARNEWLSFLEEDGLGGQPGVDEEVCGHGGFRFAGSRFVRIRLFQQCRSRNPGGATAAPPILRSRGSFPYYSRRGAFVRPWPPHASR